ncbi:hypothetical protein [Alloactinosynnema sp. L-07]|uniref:pentapeptide repeat-containing protein n=1 Tax=Alloactinosynnema sp. L-07 TaxID=1653480 RepID=UPI00065F00AD|nr:pentapeptide repeat-containing protein [Alloactinosynnema sp. L-07]CRK57874.1 hypothetical protein [Alloactinosynnema sp. L-07]
MTKRWLIGLAAVLGAVALGWLLFGPAVAWLAGGDLDQLGPKERLDAISAIRGQLTTVLSAFVVAGGLVYTARKFALDRDKQFTDRFNAAVDHLGAADATVRAGGVRALDRIMFDSPRDRSRVRETLTDFLRQHTSAAEPDAVRTRGDLRAAVSALREAPPRKVEDTPLDLRGVRLAGASLTGIALPHSRLDQADLTESNLTDADLDSARLDGATLSDAVAARTRMRSASLRRAVLAGTDLTGADCSLADLTEADLRLATLRDTVLTNAVLVNTDLRGTDLSGAIGLTAEQIRRAKLDERTKMPAGIDHPLSARP